MLDPFRPICLSFLQPVAPFDLAFISVCQPVKYRIKVKILHLTYKVLNNQAPSYHKTKWDCIVPIEHFVLRLLANLWFVRYLKVEREANFC